MPAINRAKKALASRKDYEFAVALTELRNESADFKQRLEELDYGYRRAMDLIGMLVDADRLGYTRNQVLQLIENLGTTKTVELLRRLRTKVAPAKLIEQYETRTVAQIKRDLLSRNPRKKSPATKLFTANLTPEDHRRLMKHLRKYGLKPGNGKKVGVGQAFAEMLRDLG